MATTTTRFGPNAVWSYAIALALCATVNGRRWRRRSLGVAI
jgi:hypothetical protein